MKQICAIIGCTARYRWILMAAVAALSPSMIAGCAGEDEPAPIAQQPAVDPRYATVDGLLAEFNALTTSEPVDMKGSHALFYAENQRQRDLLQLSATMIAIQPLEDAMQRRFKQSIIPELTGAFVNKPNGPATIKSSEGERATASYKDHTGRADTLQLVRYNGRWWISGYTIEHMPDLKGISDDEIRFSLLNLRILAAVAPDLTSRINGGGFTSVAAARQAMQAALLNHLNNNPADQQAFRDLVQRNPKLAERLNQATSRRPSG